MASMQNTDLSEVEEFFRDAWNAEGNTMRVLNLVAPVGSALDLFLAIAGWRNRVPAGAKDIVLFCRPNEIMRADAMKILEDSEAVWTTEDMAVMTIDDVADIEAEDLGINTVLLLELEAVPTQVGRLALGKIIAWAARSQRQGNLKDRIILVTIAACPRPWVEECFARCLPVPRKAMRLSGPDLSMAIQPLVSGGKEQKETAVAQTVVNQVGRPRADWEENAQVKGMVFVGDASGMELLEEAVMPLDIEKALIFAPRDVTASISAVWADSTIALLVVEPSLIDCTVSNPFSCVISDGMITTQVTDRVTSQLVTTTTPLAWDEVLQQMEWAKLSMSPEPAKFFAPPFTEKMMKAPFETYPTRSAWEGDLYWYLLRLVAAFPRRRFVEMPVEPIPAGFEAHVRDYVFRLRALGVIEEVKDDNIVSGNFTLDFQTAYFLAAAFGDAVKGKPNLQRLIIRIGSLIAVGLGQFITVLVEDSARLIEVAKEYTGPTPSVGRRKMDDGAVWVALALYLHFLNTPAWYNQQDASVLQVFTVDHSAATLVNALTSQLDAQLGIAPEKRQPHSVATEVSDEDLAYVEKEMMWAWLYRTIYISHLEGPGPKQAVIDVVSTRELTPCRTFMNLKAKGELHPLSGWFGFYLGLALMHKHNDGRRYRCELITSIDSRHFAAVKEYLGVSYPSAVSACCLYPQ
ncbi:hypothetical protein F4780DRAFT_744767 [Xylariomycetidae sp. FL0641]|nr:hypothetical protein F4780DRAFT_744767 [Xylariomycetidae sp. FL0641]